MSLVGITKNAVRYRVQEMTSATIQGWAEQTKKFTIKRDAGGDVKLFEHEFLGPDADDVTVKDFDIDGGIDGIMLLGDAVGAWITTCENGVCVVTNCTRSLPPAITISYSETLQPYGAVGFGAQGPDNGIRWEKAGTSEAGDCPLGGGTCGQSSTAYQPVNLPRSGEAQGMVKLRELGPHDAQWDFEVWKMDGRIIRNYASIDENEILDEYFETHSLLPIPGNVSMIGEFRSPETKHPGQNDKIHITANLTGGGSFTLEGIQRVETTEGMVTNVTPLGSCSAECWYTIPLNVETVRVTPHYPANFTIKSVDSNCWEGSGFVVECWVGNDGHDDHVYDVHYEVSAPHNLTVGINGGVGRITDSTGQIDCDGTEDEDSTCHMMFADGNAPTVTATAGTFYTFCYWMGNGVPTGQNMSSTITVNEFSMMGTDVAANFAFGPFCP